MYIIQISLNSLSMQHLLCKFQLVYVEREINIRHCYIRSYVHTSMHVHTVITHGYYQTCGIYTSMVYFYLCFGYYYWLAVLVLLQWENVFVKIFLQLLISKVNVKLLKSVHLHIYTVVNFNLTNIQLTVKFSNPKMSRMPTEENFSPPFSLALMVCKIHLKQLAYSAMATESRESSAYKTNI